MPAGTPRGIVDPLHVVQEHDVGFHVPAAGGDVVGAEFFPRQSFLEKFANTGLRGVAQQLLQGIRRATLQRAVGGRNGRADQRWFASSRARAVRVGQAYRRCN